MRYVIITPQYNQKTAGIRALQELQKWLIRSGKDAIIPNIDLNQPYLVEDDDIVVYPEIVCGNPLNAKRVVRYILNTPGKLGGDKEFSPGEILVAYSQEFSIHSNGAYLEIPLIEDFFYNQGLERTIDCVWVGKGSNTNHPEVDNALEITYLWPSNRRELAELLNRTQIFYSYDDRTHLLTEATLCGCDIRLIHGEHICSHIQPLPPDPEEFQRQLDQFIQMTWYPEIDTAKQAADYIESCITSFNKGISGAVSESYSEVRAETSDLSVLKVYYFREGADFFISPQHRGHAIPLLIEPSEGVKRVNSPQEADYLVFPFDITPLQCYAGFEHTASFLRTLPLHPAGTHRSVFYAHHDDVEPFPQQYTLFKASASMQLADPHIISVPFPVEDFAELLTFNPDDISYMTSFVGFAGSSELRARLLHSVLSETRLRAFCHLNEKFHGHLSEAEMTGNRQRYLDSLRNSLTVLCPRGTGMNSVRFYETLSMGRIPVFVGDDTVFPFEGQIAYDTFSFRIAENDLDQSGRLLFEWLSSQSPEQLLNRCRTARQAWETWFSNAGTSRMMAEELRKRRGSLGAALLLQKPCTGATSST